MFCGHSQRKLVPGSLGQQSSTGTVKTAQTPTVDAPPEGARVNCQHRSDVGRISRPLTYVAC
jgi:hypothetical protein